MKVLVTGANRGIGLEFCRQLLNESWNVRELVACARLPKESEGLLKLEKESGGRLKTISLDVGERFDSQSPSSARNMGLHLSEITSREPFDLVINNAGVYLDGGKSYAEYDFDAFRKSFEINSLGPFKVLQALEPWLHKTGVKVLQVTSLMGSIADNSSGGASAYRTSKTALNMLNRSFALDHPNIYSVVVHPGWVKTDMGGPNAHITPQVSVSGMLEIARKLTQKDSGSFLNYDGLVLPW